MKFIYLQWIGSFNRREKLKNSVGVANSDSSLVVCVWLIPEQTYQTSSENGTLLQELLTEKKRVHRRRITSSAFDSSGKVFALIKPETQVAWGYGVCVCAGWFWKCLRVLGVSILKEANCWSGLVRSALWNTILQTPHENGEEEREGGRQRRDRGR